MSVLPIIPLSLLSRVELGLLMVSQGLLLAAVLLTQLFKVEQGLSVLGEAVLLVSVEQGLMPWLRAAHCKANTKELAWLAQHASTRVFIWDAKRLNTKHRINGDMF